MKSKEKKSHISSFIKEKGFTIRELERASGVAASTICE